MSGTPRLTWEDAWLLTCLLPAGGAGKVLRIDTQLIDRMDFHMRLNPWFDAVSFGLPRLQAAGYLSVETVDGEPLIALTAAALGLVGKHASGRPVYPSTESVERSIGATGPTERRPDDRSLGRLEGYEESTFDRVVALRLAEFQEELLELPGFERVGSRIAFEPRKVTVDDLEALSDQLEQQARDLGMDWDDILDDEDDAEST